jgi:hypothetical protein
LKVTAEPHFVAVLLVTFEVWNVISVPVDAEELAKYQVFP